MIDVTTHLEKVTDKVQLVNIFDHLIWQIGLVCQQMFEGCRTRLIQNYFHINI